MPRRNLAAWSDYSRDKFLEDSRRSEAYLLFESKYGTVGTPVVFPSNSGAWLYYADHLEGKMPSLSERNTEYVEFVYREYDVKAPPDSARSDISSLKNFFGKTPAWWGDKEKDPLAQDLPTFTASHGTHAQRRSMGQKVGQQGGEKTAARFTADNGASYVMGPRDRLWLARALYGELRIYDNRIFNHLGGDAPDSEIVMHSWMIMNLLMTKYHGSSLRRTAKDYSEALQGKTGSVGDYERYGTWEKAKKTYIEAYGKGTKKFNEAKRKFHQARNQYMANVAIWPGAEEFYSTGAHVRPNGRPILIPTKLADFVNRFAAGEIPQPSGIPGKIFDVDAHEDSIGWGSGKTYGLKVEGVSWHNGTSAKGFPYTDLAPPGFAFRKKAKGYWAGVAFRPRKHNKEGVSNNLYVRRKSVSESLLRSISADKINTGVYADGVPVESQGITKRALFSTSLEENLAEWEGPPVSSQAEEPTPDSEANEQPKEANAQPDNDQQQPTTELPPEEAKGTPIKEAQEASERQQNRANWINDLAKDGWRYEGIVDGEDAFRNVFSRAKRIKIGGRDNGANSMQNIVPIAASVQFGHRLAKQKLLGHKTSTFQFLGAGNKSGALVLSAAGEAGRLALQNIKSMYNTLNHNARHMGDFREASAAKVNIVAPDGSKNNIFALLDIDKISIANISDESVTQDGVDIYNMTVEFLVRDFIEPTFKPQGVFSEDLKRKIVAQMLRDLQVKTVRIKAANEMEEAIKNYKVSLVEEDKSVDDKQFKVDLSHNTMTNPLSWPTWMRVVGTSLGVDATEQDKVEYDRLKKVRTIADRLAPINKAKRSHVICPSKEIAWTEVSEGEMQASVLEARYGDVEELGGAPELQSAKTRDASKYPQWYVDLLSKLARELKKISNRFPMFSFPVGARPLETVSVKNSLDLKWQSEDTWEDRIRDFGDSRLGGVGRKLVKLIGGSGVNVNGKNIKGFYVPNSVEAASREGAQQFMALTAILNQIAIRALQRANDGQGFASVFGKDVANKVMELAVAEYGSCYPDLDLPEIANTKIKTSPEFFLYDDSLENPGLAQLSNGANVLNKFVERHLTNSAQSIVRFIAKGGASKLTPSRNADYLQQAREKYDEEEKRERRYNGEYGGFADGESEDNDPITESAKVKDAIGYNCDKYAGAPTGSGAATKEEIKENLGWSDALAQSFVNFAQGSAKDAFYKSVVSSSYLNKFVDGGVDSELDDESKLYSRARDFFFTDAAGNIPDKIYIGPNETQVKIDATLDGEMGGGAPAGEDDKDDQTAPKNNAPNAAIASDGATVAGVSSGEMQSSEDYFNPETFEREQTVDPHVGRSLEEYEALLNKIKGTKGASTLGDRIAKDIRHRAKRDLSLRRAFPTFKIFFIDEDSDAEIGEFHAFDDFYSYSAVQEIRITRSRKIAADLAVLRITDVAHKLTRGRFADVEMTEEDLQMENEDSLGWWAETQKENPFNNRILREGVKVQIRLGYAPEPDQLETVFLGQITEIAPSEGGKILEIVCQGYGAELEAASMNDAENDVVYYSPQHALCAAILQPFINHFGHWSFNQFYNPAQIRRKYHDFYGSNLGTVDTLGALEDALQREAFYRLIRFTNFRQDPEDDNIFAPPPFLYGGHSFYNRFWDNANAYTPFLQTPWEVFKEHELRFPGYAALPLPYGHEPRMTMFFGLRGQRYWSRPCSQREAFIAKYWTDLVQSVGVGREGADELAANPSMRAGLELLKKTNPGLFGAFAKELYGRSNTIGAYIGEVSGRYRPFRNHHIFTSDRHILKNNIRTNASRTFNSVHLLYADDESYLEADDREEITESIQEIKAGGGGIYTAKMNDNLPEWQTRTYEDVFPSCVTSYMAKRYAQGLFLEGVKQSYGGELVVMGEETIKPYDVVMVQDYVSDMYGPVEVEAVTQIFNRDTGFVSVITPNMLVDINDMWARGITDAVSQSLALTYAIMLREYRSSQHRQDKTSTGLSFDSILSQLGAFHFVHWSQTASPVVCTPLMYGGKPLTSMYTGEKYSAMFSNIWGEWHQWWEDFNTGMEKGAMSEELFKLNDKIFLEIASWGGHDIGF